MKISPQDLINRWQHVIDEESDFYGWMYCSALKRCISDLKFSMTDPREKLRNWG
jgi:hypothetical protein